MLDGDGREEHRGERWHDQDRPDAEQEQAGHQGPTGRVGRTGLGGDQHGGTARRAREGADQDHAVAEAVGETADE